MRMKRVYLGNWKKYGFEFLSIFIAVISAFALNNWNDSRKSKVSEESILTEIYNGFGKDLEDLGMNLEGHKQGLIAINYFSRVINNKPFGQDSIVFYFTALARDFVSIQNTSGYETLKSKGLETIQNDSLRSRIISIYEYDYNTLRKLEEEYQEMQFFAHYSKEIDAVLQNYFQYDEQVNLKSIKTPLSLTEQEKQTLQLKFWRLQMNRRFIQYFYEQVKTKIEVLRNDIQTELND